MSRRAYVNFGAQLKTTNVNQNDPKVIRVKVKAVCACATDKSPPHLTTVYDVMVCTGAEEEVKVSLAEIRTVRYGKTPVPHANTNDTPHWVRGDYET